MSFKATLFIFDKEYPLLKLDYNLAQPVDYSGRPQGRTSGGKIYTTFAATKDDSGIYEAMFSPDQMVQGYIRVYRRDGMQKDFDIKFANTFVINANTRFNHDGTVNLLMDVEFSALIMKIRDSLYVSPANPSNPFIQETVEPTVREEEEDTQVKVDIYIDSQTGHRFKEIKPSTDIYRIINHHDYDDILSEYPNRINSKEAIDKLKLLSQEVTIDDNKIQMIIQKVDTNSRISEFQMYIVLERDWIDPINAPAIITAEEDHHTILHRDGEIKQNIKAEKGQNGNIYYKSPTGNMVIAQVHGHNKVQKSNMINLEGTSEIDQETARFNRYNVYAIESYKNETGKQAVIAKVDGMGKETLDFALTIGNKVKGGDAGTGKGTVNIGKDAIDFYSKNPRK